MNILKIHNKKVVSHEHWLIADPGKKTIEIHGCKFDLKDLKNLSRWIDEYSLTISEPITLKSICLNDNDYYKIEDFPYALNPIWENKGIYTINYPKNKTNLGIILRKLDKVNFLQKESKTYLDIKTDFDKGEVFLAGIMYTLENFEAFAPLIAWIDNYIKRGNDHFNIHLNIEYLAKGGLKVIVELLRLLVNYNLSDLKIHWYWNDDDSKEEIEEYCETIQGLKKHVILTPRMNYND